MKKKSVVLYNLLFPLWILMLFPQTWWLVLPVNFVVDLLVLSLALKSQKAPELKKTAKQAIFKTWICGFAADFAGTLGMIAAVWLGTYSRWWGEHVGETAAMEPFSTVWSFLWVTGCVMISGILIYWLNKKWCLSKIELTEGQKKRTALALAVFTAPYFFYLPAHLLYGF